MTTTDTRAETDVARRPTGLAGLAGAVAAGLALAITEFAAGLTQSVPSAVAAVGSIVVDFSPRFVERFAIEVFGTADKGALAVGTTLLALLFGALLGRVELRRPGVAAVGFAGFALLGMLASYGQPFADPVLTTIVVPSAAATGYLFLRLSLHRLVADVEAPTDALPGSASRRRFVTGVAGAGAVALVGGAAGRSMIIGRSEAVRDSMDLPQAATTVADPGPGASFAVTGLTPLIVPNDEFYRIDTALVVPRPDTASWKVSVTGMVDTELTYTLSDLLAMPLHERYVTIACVSNQVGGDLIGNAKWTGVRLTELLDRSGVHPEATQIVGRSVDGWTAGFPTALAFDGRDPLVAIGMNDEMLPPVHGFPARLIVPGLYGYVSATKWLESIELTRWEDFDGYWIPRGWSKEGPIKTQSRIDVPRPGDTVDGGAPTVIAGVAWAPTRGIARVEVRLNGREWRDADITTPLADTTWVQWRHEAMLDPGTDHRVEVRATDGDGTTQPEERTDVAPDGATGYHGVGFRTS